VLVLDMSKDRVFGVFERDTIRAHPLEKR
jgi:hypothetical protein